MKPRILFVVRDFPRNSVAVDAVARGEEALSGTHTSGVLVAEGLAERGHAVGIWVAQGQSVTATRCASLPSLAEAKRWVGDGPVVWLSYGDASVLQQLVAQGMRPILWTHLPVSSLERRWLESGTLNGIVVVSDTCKVPLLRSTRHGLVGRIYNPLAPSFTEACEADPERFSRQTVVYAGAAGRTKGLHRLLQMWGSVHRGNATAKLLLAGTGRLYGAARELGPLGIASAEFESQYVMPLIREFGSLEEARVEPLGLLTPRDLRRLYSHASLGVVNPNWEEFTETFCCAGVEMLATGLPVFSVARGALPETLERSGGAVLTRDKELDKAASELNALLDDPQRLEDLGSRGARFVRSEYGWESVTALWERLLVQGEAFETVSGRWRGPRSARYYLEYMAGRLQLHWLLDSAAAALRGWRSRDA